MNRKLLLICAAHVLAAATVIVFTDHYTNLKLGTNDSEGYLTPAIVASPNFGKICSYATDGAVISQPLYIPAVTGVTGQSGAVNLLVVSTMHGSLYAFNADKCGASLWRTNYGTVQAANSYPGDMGDLIYQRELGCKGTPAIDTAANLVYSVCSTATTWVLRKSSLLDGSTTTSVTVTGTVSGVTFCPLCHQNSAGVTLANGNAYVSFASMVDQTDHGKWYGWVFAYSMTDLSPVAVFCTTCASGNGGGGIWQSGGGLSVDATGNLYAITGNGTGTPAIGNLCLAVVKLSPTLAVIDWYATENYATYNSNDWDLSTGRPMLIPQTDLVVFGVKDFNVYSLHASCMGNIGGTSNGCSAPQVFATGSGGAPTDHQGIYGCLFVPGLNKGFFPNTNGKVYAFSLTGTTWDTTPVSTSGTYEFPGVQMSGSCNGGTGCVIWGTAPLLSSAKLSPQPAKLIAFNPVSLAEIWSTTGRTGDAVGTLAKLTVPTVAAGKIYVGTLDSTVVVYGPNQINHVLVGQ